MVYGGVYGCQIDKEGTVIVLYINLGRLYYSVMAVKVFLCD